MAKAKNAAQAATPVVAPAAAETPEAQTPRAKKLTFADLVALKVGDLATHLKQIVKLDTALSTAKETFVTSLQFNAKVVAALRRTYTERLNARDIPPDTKFPEYFEQNAGGKLPGRVEALAALFNSLCQTFDANGKPLLSEECFDNAAVDWLEKSNAIVKTAQKQHGEAWKTCDDVLDVINALSKPGDALKTIKSVRARQKGQVGDGEENAGAAQPLTVGRAIEFLKSAMRNGGAMLAAGKQDEVFALFGDTFHLHEHWEKSGIAEETLDAWTVKLMDAAQKGIAPGITVLNAGIPATPPAGAVERAAALAS
ncbi:MAG TPA: hypothetical protein VMU04_23265 [Candidatus Acidoferrum sp.]|nr:hypothetical protein [Candidatus Acidoferrum sp.]